MLFSARFLIEFYKEDQSAFEAGMWLNMGQLLSTPLILSGLSIILVLTYKGLKNTGCGCPLVTKLVEHWGAMMQMPDNRDNNNPMF